MQPVTDGVTVERIFPKKKRAKRTPTKKELQKAERTAQILELRKEGATLADIAKAVDLSGPTVSKIIKETAEKIYEGRAQEFVDLTMRRHEALLAAHFQAALNGDLEASEQCRKIIADQRTLTGIDAPKRQELTGKDGGAIEIAAASDRIEGRLADMSKRLQQGAAIKVVTKVPSADDEDWMPDEVLEPEEEDENGRER